MPNPNHKAIHAKPPVERADHIPPILHSHDVNHLPKVQVNFPFTNKIIALHRLPLPLRHDRHGQQQERGSASGSGIGGRTTVAE